MNHNLLRKAIFALLGTAVTMAVVAAPLTAQAYTVAKPEPGVTVRSYDMDEYLDMLLRNGQYEKYERFAQIADAESWAKHIANQTSWEYEYPVYAWSENRLLEAIIAKADRFGFDAEHDIFTLLAIDREKAMVKVQHGKKQYVMKLKSLSYGTWKVESVFRIK